MDRAVLYENRFSEVSREGRAMLWRQLCRSVLQRYVKAQDTVVDVGAGYCEFINQIECGRKVAIDAHPSLGEFAAPGVEAVIGDVLEVLKGMPGGAANVVFCSNFLEHLPGKGQVLEVLEQMHRVLVPGGLALIIQPNVRLAYREYWDFFDHYVPISDRSLAEALELCGFRIEVMKPGFLPFSTKSRVPKSPWLLRIYLAVPPLQWVFGKQMFVVAAKRERPA